MYFDSNHMIYVYPIVILLFVLPLLTTAFSERIFSEFNIKAFLNVFNKAIKYQVIIGVSTLILAYVVDALVYSDGEGNIYSAVFIESSYAFVVIGIFMYLPCLAILNGIVWLTNKLSK
jgi:hypothetical protein